MSRALTTGMQESVAALITQPGLLVEIMFTPPLRLSSRGPETWRGQSWIPWHIKTSGLGIDGAASSQSGTLTLGNSDLSIGVLILEQGVADRPINVWAFYGTAISGYVEPPGYYDPPGYVEAGLPADADPLQVFGGVGDNASIDPNTGTCQISLKPAAGITLYSPRLFMTKEQGWNHLPAPGSAITWGRTTITLKPEGI